MSRANETRHIKQHEMCKCKCRLDASVCNNKQHWNDDKCRCEVKNRLIKVYVIKDLFGSQQSCDVGEYLDYKNCKCRKKLADKLTEECTEDIDEVKIARENKHTSKCSSCILYIVLFSIFFATNTGISAYCVYYKYMKRDKKTTSRYDYVYQTTI